MIFQKSPYTTFNIRIQKKLHMVSNAFKCCIACQNYFIIVEVNAFHKSIYFCIILSKMYKNSKFLIRTFFVCLTRALKICIACDDYFITLKVLQIFMRALQRTDGQDRRTDERTDGRTFFGIRVPSPFHLYLPLIIIRCYLSKYEP